MSWAPHRRLLTIDEAAHSIERPASTIRRWISEGRLRTVGKIGRRALILESDLLQTDADTARPQPPTVTPA